MNIRSYFGGIRWYFYNRIVNKIPFFSIRMFLLKTYITVGNNSNILTGVEILTRSAGSKNDIIIGDNCIINTGCLLDGRVGRIIIGNNVDIARETNIFTLQHDPHDDYHNTKGGNVVINDHVWISSRVTILPGVTIGRGAVVASNAVVNKTVAEMEICAGIPAQKIGVRKSKLLYTLMHKPFLG
jgi:acetyltransferase-like isoleucine patch superfamily enzyme